MMSGNGALEFGEAELKTSNGSAEAILEVFFRASRLQRAV